MLQCVSNIYNILFISNNMSTCNKTKPQISSLRICVLSLPQKLIKNTNIISFFETSDSSSFVPVNMNLVGRLKRETLSKLSTYKIQEEKKSVSKNTVLSILELSIDYQ